MPFDKPTRNALARLVAAARNRLIEDLTAQLQSDFRLQPDGTALPLDGLTDAQRAAAEDLRELLAHYRAALPAGERRPGTASFDRLVREIGFTVLNRLSALRLGEERGLVVQCVRQGLASEGFQLYERLTGGALGGGYNSYRSFLYNLFDELAVELGALFDTRTPLSHVFPTERALLDVLDLLNKPDLAWIWQEDETIGWIYQYYNDEAERKKMRDESQAPRNSREMAVRNQFFTPRYVVEFLADNSLGRLWYEMRAGDTRLAEECRYLVRQPAAEGAALPTRAKKDPRNVTMLDPAGGSGHFGLYCFDLFETIYAEAWDDPDLGPMLREDHPDRAAFDKAVPRLILAHNIHIIDIDPRAVQIAALALWLRAQRSYQRLGLKAAERPRIMHVNVVTAEPMPGDQALLNEFVTELRPRVLGDLVRVIFEKMKLAGEAGSVLKIEDELREAIAAAKKQWLIGDRAEQLALLPGEKNVPNAEQMALFDVSDVSDESFFDEAEARVLEALRDYAGQARNGHATRRTLFAHDAAQGFAFIELCRKRYDVVLMNPPFGAPCKSTIDYCSVNFPSAAHDLAYAFVDRVLRIVAKAGYVGCITTRTGFFLPTLEEWRRSVLAGGRSLVVFADLGYGVLEALVETAGYVLSPGKQSSSTHFFDVLTSREKQGSLLGQVTERGVEHYLVNVDTFDSLPGMPFGYWAPEGLLTSFAKCHRFEPTWGEVKRGVATGDNERLLRLAWEVATDDIGAEANWIWYAKGGEYSPYHMETHLLLDWRDGGRVLRNLIGENGRLRSRPQNLEYFFRPGLAYASRTTSGFAPRVLPAYCGFDQTSNPIFPIDALPKEAVLALFLTRPVLCFIELSVGVGDTSQSGTAARDYTNGLVGRIPIPEMTLDDWAALAKLGARLTELSRIPSRTRETAAEFIAPKLLLSKADSLLDRMSAHVTSELQRIVEILDLSWRAEQISTGLYDLDSDSQEFLDSFVGPHPMAYTLFEQSEGGAGPARIETKKCYWADREFELRCHEAKRAPQHIAPAIDVIEMANRSLSEEVNCVTSYLTGCCFGRWDIRIGLDPAVAPRLAGPLDGLPQSSPGTLVSPDGLPATPGNIVSEAWLLARPNSITLPLDGSVAQPAIPDSEYPLRIAWDGVLADDPGLDPEREDLHQADVVRRVREALAVLWGKHASAIEQEACELLGVRDLREYFRKPGYFFANHLKQYSKSRRQAPIYWPLSTASGDYTIWVYYHRLTGDTLYTVVNGYVKPKLQAIQARIDRLSDELGETKGREATTLRDEIEGLRRFLGELNDFQAELLRVAGLPYKPNLNDGVILNAAPLHKLFRLRKWATDCKAAWDKLAVGEYDWAHIAYTIWPERVKKACETDPSIAIAHGLEHLYKGEAKSAGKKRGRKKKAAGDEGDALELGLDEGLSSEGAE
ncbi:MAG: BREX-1 system adenine-specific DNA-methyltransferase PglX [Anaerolineales bacterium]|nr:BREX-1 system adenine-specific DNA-methyltransferase PglX [Anaerolineales bacterium]